jgi:hypothetical protein
MATLASLGAAGLAGCDEGKGSYGVPEGPPVHVIATSLDALRVAGGEAANVPLHPRFVVRFDRILSPSADYRPNFTIRSGAFSNVTFREIRVDPVARQVVFVIADALLPQTRYVLHVESGPDAATRLAAIDGAPFAGPVDVPFTTETARQADEVDELDIDPDAAAADACSVRDLLASNCTGSSCHGPIETRLPDGSVAVGVPAMGLNLGSSAGIQATAVDQAAVGVAYEATPSGTGQPSSPVFPFGLPLIRSGQSSTSYLLYKLLKRRPEGAPKDASAFALGDVADPAGQAVSDLHAIRGSGMPHEELAPDGGPSSDARKALQWWQLHMLRRWIDAGARPCVAP